MYVMVKKVVRYTIDKISGNIDINFKVILVIETDLERVLEGRCGTVEPRVLWGPRDHQTHGYESWPRYEGKLGIHSG